MAEHLGYREAIATCMAFAMKAPGPMLVPTAVSPYLWHPTPTAMAMATLDEVAPGCAAIAVGVGNPLFLQESGRAVERPVRAMRQFTEALRKLWAGEAVHVDGEFVTLAGARLAFKPSAPIPIYIAAMGPDMLRLAGRIGDGVVLSAGLSTAIGASIDRAMCRGRRQGWTRPRHVPPRRISVLRRLARCAGRRSTRSGKSSHS